jgi:regulator of sigma E protease
MPIDFIDQLSKFEKRTILDIRRPFVIGVSDLPIKIYKPKMLYYLNGQAAKYIDQAKLY